MQTLAFDLTDAEWTEILGGNNALSLQIMGQYSIRLHFNDSATAPALNAASILIESYPPKFDFQCDTQTGQARVWARADVSPQRIIVVRRTA